MTDRYVTIHGHFYQPPRENPWLEAIERQESAHPYHDWNERITAECYAPNARSRVLDDRGRIVDIVDNYERISFNVGPTLLSWLEAGAPDTYAAILEADRRSAERFGGHGSAIAQVYNHMILPLADPRDVRTQVRWGIADFRHRFGRDPEGMWLPETAVDVDALEALAAEEIAFTILAPHQAARVRPVGEDAWTDVDARSLDTGRPYVAKLPSGRTIALFFYAGPIARAVAFERLLESGERFAERLLTGFDEGAIGPRLVHLATDGETYGHHHTHGEMALSYALRVIEEDDAVRLTNYGEFLERHPPTDEVEVVPETSWSCEHGVERWRADCGCSTGGEAGWNQAWRAPLREGLDRLRDALAPRWEAAAAGLLADPWAARDAYVEVVLDRSDGSLDRFFAEHTPRDLDAAGRVRALELLELQRHAMLMFTSCGWFFADVSGIETVQVLRYAGRAVQLAGRVLDRRDGGHAGADEGADGGDASGPPDADPEALLLRRLDDAVSNVPGVGTARDVWEAEVRPTEVDLEQVGAHYAVSGLFDRYGERARIYCYELQRTDQRRHESGRARLVVGRGTVSSVITREAAELSWAAIHLGDHNVVGGVRRFRGESEYAALAEEIVADFERGEHPAVLRLLDERFAASTYSLRSLFKDEQRRILKHILESSIGRAAAQFAQIYENRASLMRFMADLGLPPPRPFRTAAEFVLNTRLKRLLAEDDPDLDEGRRLVAAAGKENVELDAEELAFAARAMVDRQAAAFAGDPEDAERLAGLEKRVDFARDLPVHVPLWTVQNVYWRALEGTWPAMRERAAEGDDEAAAWVERFLALGGKLSVAVDGVAEPRPAGG